MVGVFQMRGCGIISRVYTCNYPRVDWVQSSVTMVMALSISQSTSEYKRNGHCCVLQIDYINGVADSQEKTTTVLTLS